MPISTSMGLTVQEFRDSDESAAALELWLKDWHKQNPDQVHPLDTTDPTEWDDTAPAPINQEDGKT